MPTKSTNHNIMNPLSISEITLAESVESMDSPTICRIEQVMYDHMNYHDPYTVYVIENSNRVYHGDLLVQNPAANKYYMSTKIVDGKTVYVIYMYMSPQGSMIPLREYTERNDAITALMMLNRDNQGGEKLFKDIFNILREYVICGNINFPTMLLSMVSKVGFKDDPELQTIIKLQQQFSYLCGCDIPSRVIDTINRLPRNNTDNGSVSASRVYSELYSICSDKLFNHNHRWNDEVAWINDTSNIICDKLYELGIGRV